MPFKTNKELTEKVKGTDKLSPRKQRQFRHVFDSCYEKNGDDSKCYAQAWSAVKNTASNKMASELLKIAREVVALDATK